MLRPIREMFIFELVNTKKLVTTRHMIANELGVSQQEVVGYILGEHGDSSFPLSQVHVGGLPLKSFPDFKGHIADTIDQDARDAAYRIIKLRSRPITVSVASLRELLRHYLAIPRVLYPYVHKQAVNTI